MYSKAYLHVRAKPVGWPASRWRTPPAFKRSLNTRVHQPHHSSHPSHDEDDSISISSWNGSPEAASSVWGARASNPTVSAAALPISLQSLNMAFHLLDRNEDGLINRAEAYRMVAFYLALQHYKPPEPAAKPLTWDQHLLASIAAANKTSGGRAWALWAALEAFVAAKVSGGLQKTPPRCSDLVWAGLGMATAFMILGVLAAAAKALPVVGQWHQQGLPMLLGSFGTFAILLFGKPEAEAVRLWPIIAGQLGATAIAISMIQLFGASLLTRACALSATVMYMMWTDTLHPPGGALVLISMDNAAVQQLKWAYLLWPSLLLCLAVMMPISAATNWLRRNRQFDWPGTSSPAATLQQKQKAYKDQQQKKADMLRRHTAMLLSDRVIVPLVKTHTAGEDFAQMKGTVFRLKGLSKALAQYQAKQQLERLWNQQAAQKGGQEKGKAPEHVADKTDTFIAAAGRLQSPAAAALDATVKKRLRQDSDRKLEDQLYRKHLWGPAVRNFEHFERKLQKLHEERLNRIQQQQNDQEQQQPDQPMNNSSQQQPAASDKVSDSSVSSNPSLFPVSGIGAGSRTPSRASCVGNLSIHEDPDWQQQVLQQQMNLYSQRQPLQSDKPAWMYRWRSDIATTPGVGDFGSVRPLDSFAPDDQPKQKLP